jgi:hypothetical protein
MRVVLVDSSVDSAVMDKLRQEGAIVHKQKHKGHSFQQHRCSALFLIFPPSGKKGQGLREAMQIASAFVKKGGILAYQVTQIVDETTGARASPHNDTVGNGKE